MNEKRILFALNGAPLPRAVTDPLSLAGYQVLAVRDDDMALSALDKQRFDLLISHLARGPEDGSVLREKLVQVSPNLPLLVIVPDGAASSFGVAVERSKNYMSAPCSADEILERVAQLIAAQNKEPTDFVASDPASSRLLRLARRVAATDVSVLIGGESGTGKEVLANFIHQHSARSRGPFVAVNCAAIPENMLEAILFGYEKGAFTGAHQSNPGKFEQAQDGVLLLDEISEMDVLLQAKLLRVLQEREVERLGGRKALALDVRVVATTNRDLREEVRAGRFREDLYYRLNVFPLRLCPLSERKGDIRPLAERMIQRHVVCGGVMPELSSNAIELLQNHNWPGNVRELDNVVQRALVLCNGASIRTTDLHFETCFGLDNELPTEENQTLSGGLETHENRLILQALDQGNGSRKTAAERLGISARTLRYKIARMRESGIPVPT